MDQIAITVERENRRIRDYFKGYLVVVDDPDDVKDTLITVRREDTNGKDQYEVASRIRGISNLVINLKVADDDVKIYVRDCGPIRYCHEAQAIMVHLSRTKKKELNNNAL